MMSHSQLQPPLNKMTVFILLLLWLNQIVCCSSANNGESILHNKEQQASSSTSSSIECNLYMGPSTIPNAGLGIFTGKAYSVKNDKYAYIGNGDICIPIIDMYTHINMYGTIATSAGTTSNRNDTTMILSYPQQRRNYVFNPLRDYFWSGTSMGMYHGETSSNDLEAYCPGLDCAINCHLGLTNIDKSVPTYNDYHSILVNDVTQQEYRYVHPGTGAYSPYHIRPPTKEQSKTSTTPVTNTKIKSNLLRDIPIGGELFKHYGEHWFTSRQDIFGNIPLTNDYVYGEQILQKFMSLKIVTQQQQQEEEEEEADQNMIQDLYNNVIIQTMQRIYDTRLLNALPRSYTEVKNVILQYKNEVGSSEVIRPSDIITRILQSKHVRSIHELQTKGVCLDHIRPDTSTIKYAGYGAFATRFLPQNTIITASPLHHIPDKYNFMNMYAIRKQPTSNNKQRPHDGNIDDIGMGKDTEDKTYYRVLDEVQNLQVLINYCYGHVNSTLVLCPYGSGINYMNHHHTNYNVRVEWVQSNELIQTFGHNVTAVQNGTVSDLFVSEKSQLAIQYVAIRDIQMNEELFIDYGIEWENMWNQHVQEFYNHTKTNHNDYITYVSASYWNIQYGTYPLPTVQEQKRYDQSSSTRTSNHTSNHHQNMKYPPNNLQIRCHRTLLVQPISSYSYTYKWTEDNFGIPCRIIDRYNYTITNLDDYQDNGDNEFNADMDLDNGTNATKVELYTVLLEWNEGDDSDDEGDGFDTSTTWIQRTDVPRSAIRLYDLPYTTDIHTRPTFRHPIYLSNTVFPKQWRNLEV